MSSGSQAETTQDLQAAASAPEPPRPHDPQPVALRELAEALGLSVPDGADDLFLTGITLDSRSVQQGDLWAALPGAKTHGARFAAQAAQQGAVCALTDAEGAELCAEAGLPAVIAQDPRAMTARAAACVHHDAWSRISTIGVTGTNGKTSVTTMVHYALTTLGRASGVVGTSGTAYRDRTGAAHAIGTVRTTPEAPELHGILARMDEDGVEVCSMEISSHAMSLHRADAVVCTVACFTNLSQDHLDFHPTMEDYFAAKAMLFTPEHARRGVVCVDDPWGRSLAATASIPVITYTTRPDVEADVSVIDAAPEGYGTTFTVRTAQGEAQLRAALPGMHYVANTIAAWLLLREVGVSGEDATRALADGGLVPGRMELVAQEPVRGVVDYSHTPDALEKALQTLRAVPGTKRLITVMGAGGDRDRSKRPLMGAVAAELSDLLVITDDNPRTEDPTEIRAQVKAGIRDHAACEVHVVEGRAQAIRLAADLADVGDTILVAGKGAEDGQDIGGIVHPFDDREQLRTALAERGAVFPDRIGATPTPATDGDH